MAHWDNGSVGDAGAVTFGNGTTGVSGVISSSNSLVGVSENDQVGYGEYGTLWRDRGMTNGNYVVASPFWDNGSITDAGAATFGDGTTGVSGAISSANSLVGSTEDDLVGFGDFEASAVTALTNGNYVVSSYNWDSSTEYDVGAVTFGNGITGVSGVISSANSLVGSSESDQVGHTSAATPAVTALTNGNYVVSSVYWNNGAVSWAGAVTFGNGTTGVSGVVSAANSLVGSSEDDFVGYSTYFIPGVIALSNGNYVVSSLIWDNGTIVDAGAVTFGDGTTGVVE